MFFLKTKRELLSNDSPPKIPVTLPFRQSWTQLLLPTLPVYCICSSSLGALHVWNRKLAADRESRKYAADSNVIIWLILVHKYDKVPRLLSYGYL